MKSKTTIEKVDIYTDGSCLGNPGPGGWGAVILLGEDQIEISGYHNDTTNNRMEMTAIMESLKWLRNGDNFPENDLPNLAINIYSDSSLIINTLNQGWKRKANVDLWSEFDKLRAWLNIHWFWVKGHATNKYNNLADKLATERAAKQR